MVLWLEPFEEDTNLFDSELLDVLTESDDAFVGEIGDEETVAAGAAVFNLSPSVTCLDAVFDFGMLACEDSLELDDCLNLLLLLASEACFVVTGSLFGLVSVATGFATTTFGFTSFKWNLASSTICGLRCFNWPLRDWIYLLKGNLILKK